jgi:hypothetical protein
MFQRVISCVAAFWITGTPHWAQRNLVSFLIFFRTQTRHFRVGVFLFFCGWNMDQFVIPYLPIKPPRGVIFWSTFCWSRRRCSTRALRLVKCWLQYKWSSFVPAALLSLKWMYRWISWNLFLDIFCGNNGVWKIHLVDQYNSNFGFRTISVTKIKSRIFFFFYFYCFPFFTTCMVCNGTRHFRDLLLCI